MGKIFVWDVHTRLFHWLLFVFFMFSLSSGLLGDFDLMEWHMLSGSILLALILFRLACGFVAKDYSHFRHFHLRPKSVIDYVKGKRTFGGHNPMGAWMVVIMLASLLLQILSGFMTTDDVFVEGPWVYRVSDFWISLSGNTHSLNYYVLIALSVAHVSAIAYYRWIKGEDLLTPMLTGVKNDSGDNASDTNTSDTAAVKTHPLIILIIAAIAGGISWYAVTFL